MTKSIKLDEPRQRKAAREYLNLAKNLQEHIEFLTQEYDAKLKDAGVKFNKKFREQFVIATHGHLPDPEAAFAESTHLILENSLEPEGGIYLMTREDWKAKQEKKPKAVDHSALFEAPVLH